MMKAYIGSSINAEAADNTLMEIAAIGRAGG
jgi:hypothetical protein